MKEVKAKLLGVVGVGTRSADTASRRLHQSMHLLARADAAQHGLTVLIIFIIFIFFFIFLCEIDSNQGGKNAIVYVF
jgi:hypothetical protein